MPQSRVELLPLCSIPAIADREGRTGANAYMNTIGIGIHYASGDTVDLTSARIPQDTSRTFVGVTKPNLYNKGFTCSSGSEG